MGPADETDAFADDEGLRIEITESAIGVIGSLGPGPDGAFAIARDAARAEAVGEEDDVASRCQQLPPSRLARDQCALLIEQAGAAVRRHDRRKWTGASGSQK